MKVLIIGGNRFFGKRLTQNLLNSSADITLLTRGQHKDNFGNQVNRIQMDRKTLDAGHPSISDHAWDFVFDQVCYDSLEAQGACQTFEGKVKNYIFTSSQSVYRWGQSIKESSFEPLKHEFKKPITRELDYAEAKRQAESTFFKQATFPVAAVRFPIVLGEDDHDRRLHFHIQAILEGKPIYFPKVAAKISFINSEDAAGFLASFTHIYRKGPVNCCSTEPITLKDFISILEETVKKKALITDNPNEGEHSPFGIEADWYMNTDKLQGYQYNPKPISQWLPEMVSKILNN